LHRRYLFSLRKDLQALMNEMIVVGFTAAPDKKVSDGFGN